MFGAQQYEDINKLLNQAFAAKKVLIAAHRGTWGGNIAENTCLAYKIALDMGADMFECDVSKSTDGVLYAFHNREEERCFGIKEDLLTLPSEEIDKLIYRNSLYLNSGARIERLKEVAAHFKNGELYNIDRAWDYLPEVLAVLDKFPHAIKQALIKSPVKAEVLNFLQNCPQKYMYMPIVYSMEDVQTVLSYTDINTVGMELIAKSPEAELFQDENIRYIKDKGLFIWANAITLGAGERWVLFGGLDDDLALTEGADAAWGELVKKGVDIIQTDWPYQVKTFLDGYSWKGD
ncbi:MAG: glycerophosphodiester phosphodiesterase family protein [Defluviitaleaceae bacterium]|nr:glycerophosphodiester phosphodiesterase family protein [Defluviitaleaceae bacterium]